MGLEGSFLLQTLTGEPNNWFEHNQIKEVIHADYSIRIMLHFFDNQEKIATV